MEEDKLREFIEIEIMDYFLNINRYYLHYLPNNLTKNVEIIFKVEHKLTDYQIDVLKDTISYKLYKYYSKLHQEIDYILVLIKEEEEIKDMN